MVVERHDGEVVENMTFKGKISKIYLNSQKNLEISFERGIEVDNGDLDEDDDFKKHITIPIREQIEEQEKNNESVYIKIDLQNEDRGYEVEEILFKVLPEGRVERQYI